MGRIILMLCGVIFVCGSSAWAQDWKFFYEREGVKYYFDKAGIVRPDKTTARVTERVTKKAEEGEESGKEAGEAEKPAEIDTERSEYEINCKDRSFKILSFTAFDPETGKELVTEQRPATGQKRMGVFFYDRIGALYENICP